MPSQRNARPTRWATDTGEGHSRWLIEHFRRLADEGADLGGEARFLDMLLPRRSAVLDAGCGTGRVGAVLAATGHRVIGVDADPELIEEARAVHAGLDWRLGDLADLDTALGDAEPFDGAILAGNVMPYLAPGTEVTVLRGIAGRLRPGAPLVAGFGDHLGYRVADFDLHAASAGLLAEHRFASWTVRPWRPGGDYAVTVLRAR